MYYFGATKQLVSTLHLDSETKRANNLVWSLSDLENPPKNISLEEYLNSKNVKSPQIDLLEAGYANTLCSTLNNLEMSSTCSLERRFTNDGHGDFRFLESMSKIVDILAEGKEEKILKNQPVVSVIYGKDHVEVTSKSGKKFTCDHLVLTIPVTQYRNNSIQFSPSLPENKISAINNIRNCQFYFIFLFQQEISFLYNFKDN